MYCERYFYRVGTRHGESDSWINIWKIVFTVSRIYEYLEKSFFFFFEGWGDYCVSGKTSCRYFKQIRPLFVFTSYVPCWFSFPRALTLLGGLSWANIDACNENVKRGRQACSTPLLIATIPAVTRVHRTCVTDLRNFFFFFFFLDADLDRSPGVKYFQKISPFTTKLMYSVTERYTSIKSLPCSILSKISIKRNVFEHIDSFSPKIFKN